jgi:small subunit ribosomal protein S18
MQPREEGRKTPRDKMSRRDMMMVKRRYCQFCDNPKLAIDYKNTELLRDYLSERGKITARRVSGACAKHQREMAREIKRARYLALLPYKVDIYR